MKKKNLLFVAAAMVMAGCASDDMIGDNAATQSDNQVIGFNMNMPAVTRAASQETGKDAAKSLNYEFIVWGEKDESNTTATSIADNPNLVFENYRVQYKDNNGSTANSTASNTTGWDYVGITPYTNTQVLPAISTTQTIKYWDFGKNSSNASKVYTFTAVSALESDIKDGKVKIRKNYDGTTKATHGYTIELTNGAKAENIFVSDRKEYTPTQPAAGGTMDAVTLAFRNFQTKIRFGFYETVPGYDVQITGVKYNGSLSDSKFGVDGTFVQNPGTGSSDKITYNVTYESAADGAKPVLTTTLAGTTSQAYEEFGDNMFTNATSKKLGKESTSPLYDIDGGGYSVILPNTNGTDMTFEVSYKLISEDTKEEIQIDNRKVTVPSEFCKWKPNFAYTYLFKVSDASAELYPITFDAVVEADQDSKQETITEVGEPSITTYATVSGADKTVVTGKNEYNVGNVIYAVTNVSGGMTSSNTKLYKVVATKGTNATVVPDITEASVKNCIEHGVKDTNKKTWTVEDVNESTLVATDVTDATNNFSTTVPTEDGLGTRTINALTWTPDAAATYAVEFTTGGKTYYKIVKVVAQ